MRAPRSPAESIDRPNFVTDYPVQGPTDPGIRAADCWWKNNVLPAQPACADCKGGPIPMWTRQSIPGGTQSTFGRERLSFGGVGLSAAGDPSVWESLTAAQQTWVLSALTTLNGLITAQTNTMCSSWVPPTGASGITNATGCFQDWFNANPEVPTRKLRTDGVFDQETLSGLQAITQLHASDFPNSFPGSGTDLKYGVLKLKEKKKISTAGMVGIAAAGAAVIGGIVYAVSKHDGKRKKRRK